MLLPLGECKLPFFKFKLNLEKKQGAIHKPEYKLAKSGSLSNVISKFVQNKQLKS
jgi:hypothetical protein